MWFPNRSDTKSGVRLQKQARSLKFWRLVEEELYYRVAKTKALISFAITAKLICVFVFAYADYWFSHEVAHNKSGAHIIYKKYQKSRKH